MTFDDWWKQTDCGESEQVREVSRMAWNAAQACRAEGVAQDGELATYRKALEQIINDPDCDGVQVAHEAITPYTPWKAVRG